ncbi:MAG: GIY-YIG nuclease family protein [Myxococcales bacterium FL481]|nr:MAG: GIY-YIG nuclease family protein [Myxococcales bacterium FL481]
MTDETSSPPAWWVYVLLSADQRRTYVGITTDLVRRLAQHNRQLPGGAKATRAGGPWAIGATYGPYPDRGHATRMEHAIKQRSGRERLHYAAR